MDAQIPSTLTGMLAFFVTTGVFSLVWAAAIETAKAVLAKNREAKYLAVRSAVALESHAIACWHELQMAKGFHGDTGAPYITGLPTAPQLPEDVNWQSIPPELAAKIFSFFNESDIEEYAAKFAHRYEGNAFDYASATQKQGRAAWALARELRRRYRLPLLDEQRARLTNLDE